ncbi:sensor histidine kinase [Tessaracoccus caeni]|uniref:sensor histidine kinase n=1 Tax=Tessaracoccus caeni TaxID=3031239 RepID=UPI0023DA5758|nr:histidine kinase [Tessaracoccus caeni]MDF1488922.1 histidine kinase [Tessaracoccus caeni]
MSARQILASGWIEAGVAALWVGMSFIGFISGEQLAPIFVWDFAMFLGVLVAVRWLLPGIGLICGLLVAGLWVDPSGVGLSSYIAATAVALAVRKEQFRGAVLLSTVVLLEMAVLVVRRSRTTTEVLIMCVASVVVLVIPWVLGLGFRWVMRAEAERVSRAYVERQMRMAVDIHDFVGRNLTGILVRAETASDDERTAPAFFDELIERVRSADATLRQVTADLQREGPTKPFQVVGADDALRAGIAELTAAGFDVHPANADVTLAQLSPEVDLVVSRIIAEALHNVVKHGDPIAPCRVAVQRRDDVLTLVVENGIKHGRRDRKRPLGLVGMGRHAGLAGGAIESAAIGNTWVCRASIPLVRTRSSA